MHLFSQLTGGLGTKDKYLRRGEKSWRGKKKSLRTTVAA